MPGAPRPAAARVRETERLALDVPDHPGAVLRVEVHHGDAPVTALFSSGLGLPLDLWHPVVALLPDVRCVLVDRPGTGGSTAWHRVVDLPEEVGLLGTVLDAVHPDADADPVVLVGHSHGGLHVEGLARTRPGAVRSVVLVDPSDPEREARAPRLEGSLGDVAARAVSGPRLAPATAGLAALAVLSGGAVRGAAPRVVRMRRRPRPATAADPVLGAAHEALVRAYEQPDQLSATVAELAAAREDALGLLRLAAGAPLPDVPLELVVAVRGGWPGHRLRRSWLRTMARRAHTLGPRTVTTLADAGHLVMLDAPELLATVLRRAAGPGPHRPPPDRPHFPA